MGFFFLIAGAAGLFERILRKKHLFQLASGKVLLFGLLLLQMLGYRALKLSTKW
jgi:hypothetical protein